MRSSTALPESLILGRTGVDWLGVGITHSHSQGQGFMSIQKEGQWQRTNLAGKQGLCALELFVVAVSGQQTKATPGQALED